MLKSYFFRDVIDCGELGRRDAFVRARVDDDTHASFIDKVIVDFNGFGYDVASNELITERYRIELEQKALNKHFTSSSCYEPSELTEALDSDSSGGWQPDGDNAA